jgi:hypothetical protein
MVLNLNLSNKNTFNNMEGSSGQTKSVQSEPSNLNKITWGLETTLTQQIISAFYEMHKING